MDKIRALIVDDSSVMRKIVERSLRQAGIELEKVVEAANGAEALAALQSNVVDLILCDINMPVMDGLEFVRQVATVETAKRGGYCHPRQRLDSDSHCPSRGPGSRPSRDPGRNKDTETISGCRPQAHGRKVRRPSSTAVVPSRVRVRRE